MYETVKTIHHTRLEIIRANQLPFTTLEHTTLNEKFGFAATEDLPNGVYPTMNYIAIGRGAHRGRLDESGLTIIDIARHDIDHAALYEHIPFIMRPVTEDLSPAERLKYGGRILKEVDGNLYFAYMLKVLPFEVSYPEVKTLTVANGEVTETDYTPSPSLLDPELPPFTNNTAETSSGIHLAVESELELSLNENDINEILNAVEIIYGSQAYATISEFATVTGIRGTVTSPLGGGNVSYEEVLAAQCANFIPANIDLKFTTREITHQYTVGLTAPRNR